jgi:hypothetical protein
MLNIRLTMQQDIVIINNIIPPSLHYNIGNYMKIIYRVLVINLLIAGICQSSQYNVFAISSKKQASNKTLAEDRLSSPMTFSTHQECAGNACAYYILAEGLITPETPTKFSEFMDNLKALPVVYFNSPGGNLIAGLELGRLIRDYGLDTYVGREYVSFEGFNSDENEVIRTRVRNGICYSACAYSFMGGTSREIAEGGSLGVHQFYTQRGDSGEAYTQLTMTILAKYLDDMGIDRRVLDIASFTGSNKIKTISQELAQELNIDNINPPKGQWNTEVTESGQLYSYVWQKQARKNAEIAMFISRQGNQFLINVRYLIKQKFRSTKELIKAFSDSDLPPNLCIHNQEGNCSQSITPKLTRNWTYQNDGAFLISFILDPQILMSIARAPGFEFSVDFPRVYRDIDPSDSFSTKNLQPVLKALLKQR